MDRWLKGRERAEQLCATNKVLHWNKQNDPACLPYEILSEDQVFQLLSLGKSPQNGDLAHVGDHTRVISVQENEMTLRIKAGLLVVISQDLDRQKEKSWKNRNVRIKFDMDNMPAHYS